MNVFAICVITIALFGSTIADEFNKDEILKLYECIACGGEDPIVEEDYDKCFEIKSEKGKDIDKECLEKHLPTDTTFKAQASAICKNDNEIASTIYDCIHDEEKEHLNVDEKTMEKKHLHCLEKIAKKHCHAK